jgi:broad specificity phosphatase PhoE
MTLYLVRHGRAQSGVEELDPGLDAIGASQAGHVAEALASSGAKRLVCSPLRRARETAAPIAALLGLSPEICEDISEVFPPDMQSDARRAMLGPFLSGLWSRQSPELREWRERTVRALVSFGGGEPVIVVSHFVAISAAIGASTDDDRISPCALANASITRMEVTGGKLVLRRPGEVAHLPPDEITATHAAIPGRK